MKYLCTTNELGNYITKRLAFLLKEKPEYTKQIVIDRKNKYRRVLKHTAAYFNKSEILVEYDYKRREIIVSTNELYKDYIYSEDYIYSLVLQTEGFFTTEHIDKEMEKIVSTLSPF